MPGLRALIMGVPAAASTRRQGKYTVIISSPSHSIHACEPDSIVPYRCALLVLLQRINSKIYVLNHSHVEWTPYLGHTPILPRGMELYGLILSWCIRRLSRNALTHSLKSDASNGILRCRSVSTTRVSADLSSCM